MYRMLIVDDERIIRETLSRHIDWAALDVQVIGTASNGLEAYDIIMDEYPDIVMTDIKMPGFSGLELLQRIKSLHPDIEFILLSGYGEFEYAQKAMQWGVRHYLLKPCSELQIIGRLAAGETLIIDSDLMTAKVVDSNGETLRNGLPLLSELNFPVLNTGDNTIVIAAVGTSTTFTELNIQARSRWR